MALNSRSEWEHQSFITALTLDPVLFNKAKTFSRQWTLMSDLMWWLTKLWDGPCIQGGTTQGNPTYWVTQFTSSSQSWKVSISTCRQKRKCLHLKSNPSKPARLNAAWDSPSSDYSFPISFFSLPASYFASFKKPSSSLTQLQRNVSAFLSVTPGRREGENRASLYWIMNAGAFSQLDTVYPSAIQLYTRQSPALGSVPPVTESFVLRRAATLASIMMASSLKDWRLQETYIHTCIGK